MRRVLRGLLLCMLWLALTVAAAQADSVNRALLIGCDVFLTAENTAPSSANNVTSMASALGGGAMNLDALVTRRSGVSGVDEFSELVAEVFAGADADDVSYFYISTHGLWNQTQPGGDMVLLLSDGRTEERLTAYQLRRIFDLVPGTKVLIIDACHSGAMLGKGVPDHFENVFAGGNYIVLCSSGGSEESWFWSGSTTASGEGYFSGMLVSGLSAKGGFAADDNHDGVVTLTELKRYLRQFHGASTVQTYPEESDFAMLTYDPGYSGRAQDSILDNITFESGALSHDSPEICFSFTMLRPAQVAYQLVYQRDGRWDFAGAKLIWDNAERFGAYGDAQGWLTPGFKERTIGLSPEETGSYGYVLLQVLTVQNGGISIAASQVLCVPPSSGDPRLSFTAPIGFCPDVGEELTFVVNHAFPCELTVTVETQDGQIVRRLCSRQATRPEQLLPTGSSFTWSGLLADGSAAPEGIYRLHVRACVGGVWYECWSSEIMLASSVG